MDTILGLSFEPLAKNCQESLARKGKEIKIVAWRGQPPHLAIQSS